MVLRCIVVKKSKWHDPQTETYHQIYNPLLSLQYRYSIEIWLLKFCFGIKSFYIRRIHGSKSHGTHNSKFDTQRYLASAIIYLTIIFISDTLYISVFHAWLGTKYNMTILFYKPGKNKVRTWRVNNATLYNIRLLTITAVLKAFYG